MKLSRKQIQGTALLIAGLVFVLPAMPGPSYGYTATDVNLASAKNYSLVVGGVLVVGATPHFSGTAAYAGALSGSIASDTYLSVLATGGLTSFANDTTAADTALSDVTSARNIMNNFAATTLPAGEIGGSTFTPGVYATGGALTIGSSITLNGGGNYNSIFIFRAGGAITITGSIVINCIGGAQPANIYWIAADALDVGAGATVRGNFIAGAVLTTADSSIIYGSALGLGAVNVGASSTIIHNSIEVDPTVTASPSPSASDTSTATASPSTSATASASPSPTVTPSATAAVTPTPTPKPLIIPLVTDLWFIENESKTGGKLNWSGTNLESWLFQGEAKTYPKPYNYGAFTSGWLGELSNMVPGIEYVMSMDFRSSTGASVTKTISYTIQPFPIVEPLPTPSSSPTPTPSLTPIAEIPKPKCDSVITNLQYIPGPAGTTTGQLTWQTSGTGKVQYFGDIFLYPAIFSYGMFTTQWSGSLLNLMPGIRYIVSVNFFADCERLSGVSTSAMNPELVISSPIPTPSLTPSPAVSPSPTPTSSPVVVVTATPTSAPSSSVITTPSKAPEIKPTATPSAINTFLPNFSILPNSRNPLTGQESIHIVLHNLIPGQTITITLRSEDK